MAMKIIHGIKISSDGTSFEVPPKYRPLAGWQSAPWGGGKDITVYMVWADPNRRTGIQRTIFAGGGVGPWEIITSPFYLKTQRMAYTVGDHAAKVVFGDKLARAMYSLFNRE